MKLLRAHAATLLLTLSMVPVPIITLAAPAEVRPGDEILSRVMHAETGRLEEQCLAGIQSLDDWNGQKGELRRQLAEMLGVWPMPEKSELKATVTGTTEHEGIVVENLHFQSLPGFYVTANLYRPRQVSGRLPAILYLSGHGPVISNGVSYGNKVSYQHHGAWFARNGYVCLILDSVQLGEILGLHHGTYRENLWWWNSRGYTPAGAEAWNCIRALDYLSTRPDVDSNRFGVTGRSGGGAYSWWVATLDDRIKAAAPVAGITDLHNHVVDGTVEGHCDCMFTVNTYRWDYAQVAALVAPRPLLIVNTDADSIFPLDGVQRLHAKVRDIYRLHGAEEKLGLVIAPGPHKDTQDLQVPVFRWFNRHLRSDDPVIEMAAVKLFTPEQLRVFRALPVDAINTNIHETFVAQATPARVARSKTDWLAQRDGWLSALNEKTFRGWPGQAPAAAASTVWSADRDGLRLEAVEFQSEQGLPLRVYLAQGVDTGRPRELVATVLDDAATRPAGTGAPGASFGEWLATMASVFGDELKAERAVAGDLPPADEKAFEALRRDVAGSGRALAWIVPRGVGLTAWSNTPRKQVQTRRRYMLLGQTLDGMRVWDIRQALKAVRSRPEWQSVPVILRGTGSSACDALYASLYEAGIERLELRQLPSSHRGGPDYLNVLKTLDVPQALAMAVERVPVVLGESDSNVAKFARETADQLGWGANRIRGAVTAPGETR